MKRTVITVTASMLCLVASVSFAKSPWLSDFKTYYGIPNNDRLDTCYVCHVEGQSFSVRNPYGIDLKNIGNISSNRPNAFAATNALDSDNDSWANGVEISYDRFPGDASDIVPVNETTWGQIKALYK